MKFLTGAVIASFIACLVFTVVVIVLSCFGYAVPDTLIQYFFMAFGLEFGAAAAIKISKHQIKKAEVKERIGMIKENNLELDKTDLKNSSTSDGYDDYESYEDSIMG